ncbi:MAG: hypothetical protein FJ134_04700 [Deltaproteobacteria bacterium]|nr:hypothetical protein [Deltaproteobacteria bacterium]
MPQFACPYLKGEVELTQERENHIIERHPELAADCHQLLADTLMSPDLVRRSVRLGNARLFSRWFPQVRGGKHLVVVVVTAPAPGRRHWIVTAYLARRLAEGETEWQRN